MFLDNFKYFEKIKFIQIQQLIPLKERKQFQDKFELFINSTKNLKYFDVDFVIEKPDEKCDYFKRKTNKI